MAIIDIIMTMIFLTVILMSGITLVGIIAVITEEAMEEENANHPF